MNRDLLLVTGATGQIGSAVVRAATDAGWHVRVLVRDHAAASSLFAGRDVDIRVGDLLNPAVYPELLPDVTHVCNSAARVGDWGPPEEFWQTNVQALRHFLDAIGTESGRTVRRFIQISSLGVYEPRDHYGTTEDEPPYPNGLDAYHQSKFESEALALNHAINSNVSTLVLRPGFVYGPGDRHVLPELIKALKRGLFTFIGSGEEKLDQVSVGNVAHAVMLALTAADPSERVFNITDREPVSRRTFVNTLSDLLHIPRPTRSMPKRLGWAIAATCDRIGRLFNLRKPPVLSKARYKFLAINLEYSCDRARRILGYDPPEDFPTAMAAAVQWQLDREGKSA